MVYRHQDLNTSHVHCYWGVTTPWFTQWSELGNICVLMYIHIHSFASLLNENRVFMVLPHNRDHSRIFPFNVCNSLLWPRETWLALSLIFLFSWSTPCVYPIFHFHHYPLPCSDTLFSRLRLSLPIPGQPHVDTQLTQLGHQHPLPDDSHMQTSLRTTEGSQVELHFSLLISHLPPHC